MVTIKGHNPYATITNKEPVLKIEHDSNDEKVYNFETIAALEKDRAPFDFDPYSNLNVTAISKK